MDSIRKRFQTEIETRLSGAAESEAKAEIIDELVGNLTGRYDDLTAAGVDDEDAFARALESLGDVNGILAYLNGQPSAGQEQSVIAEDPVPAGPAAPPAGDESPDGLSAEYADTAVPYDDTAPVLPKKKQSVFAIGVPAPLKKKGFSDVIAPALSEGGPEQDEAFGSIRDGALFYDEGSDEWTVSARAVTGLDVKLQHGDVDVDLVPSETESITIDGDVAGLSVALSDAGILTIREGHLLRGVAGREVFIEVPDRGLTSIRVATAVGDVDITAGIDMEGIDVHTGSGDIGCSVSSCVHGAFKTLAGGDIDCEGNWQSFKAETVSGDIDLVGSVGDAQIKTAAGDVSLEGVIVRARVRSVSGDIDVVSQGFPQGLDLSSKKGDIDVELPEGCPFHAKLNTVSGDVDNEFPSKWTSRFMLRGQVPQYTLSSISGDISLMKLT